MAMSVSELNRDQLNQLKESYYYQLLENDDDVLFALNNPNGKDIEGILDWHEIPDSVILEHYADINFVDDDFWDMMED